MASIHAAHTSRWHVNKNRNTALNFKFLFCFIVSIVILNIGKDIERYEKIIGEVKELVHE